MQKFTGLEYLKIDIASNFGLDKSNWNDRLAWFDKNEAQLDNLLNQAEEPALFYAGVKAYRDTLNGSPTGYMISLDATSSGLQLLACLTGDTPAAKLCNVVSTGKRECAYKNIYKLMTDALGENMTASPEDTKQAIMTSMGSLIR